MSLSNTPGARRRYRRARALFVDNICHRIVIGKYRFRVPPPPGHLSKLSKIINYHLSYLDNLKNEIILSSFLIKIIKKDMCYIILNK